MANAPAQPAQAPIRNVQNPRPGQVKSPGQPVSTSIPQRLSAIAKEVYWCMDEIFSEPKETWLRPVAGDADITDEKFYELTNRALDKARGGLMKDWLLKRLSWKRCFHIVKTNRDQVLLGQIELPPQEHLEYEHGMLTPEDVHMKLAAVQMVAGLMDPKTARGEKTVMTMLPKKKIPPNFKREMGMCGWGIYAQMGFSVKKILWWLIFCMISMSIFAAVWLVCINSTDLQNAFMPATIVLTLFTIVLGVAQSLG
ncbi:uncharacterized protein ColSpa_12497 [Colletotrichum spaethianum]|uniref:Uncharacterized protein n=1 Tax=Colletotrichum spaethianum TaxID=700344 RepID=A0AA37PHA9_9PEZI|nr:uncharacterized protein ColSpa_12497 [Colletotrichum spaethianum]GKT52316.1 hypothetical protein ColSpa_12497 [Colletotrichum spaethianum]